MTPTTREKLVNKPNLKPFKNVHPQFIRMANAFSNLMTYRGEAIYENHI